MHNSIITSDILASLTFNATTELNTNSNILVDKIESYISSKALSLNETSTLEGLIDGLDTFNLEHLEDVKEVDYETAKLHQELVSYTNKEYNLVRNAVSKRQREMKAKYAALDAYETIQNVNALLNEKDNEGNYIRQRNDKNSIFRTHAHLTYKLVPHKDGSGRMFRHEPETKTFFKKDSAILATESNPFVLSYTISDEWEDCAKAWKLCRNADSSIITESMLDALKETTVIKTLDAGYKMYQSKRSSK